LHARGGPHAAPRPAVARRGLERHAVRVRGARSRSAASRRGLRGVPGGAGAARQGRAAVRRAGAAVVGEEGPGRHDPESRPGGRGECRIALRGAAEGERRNSMNPAEARSAAPGDRLELQMPDAKPTYSPGEAVGEANRCLYCHDAPCVTACPTGSDIPAFIRKIATGNVRGWAKRILSANLLGYSCARVCPVEVLCVGACVYNDWRRYPPIQIGRLQRYAVETVLDNGKGAAAMFEKAKPAG